MEGDRQAYSIQAREQIRKQQWISFTIYHIVNSLYVYSSDQLFLCCEWRQEIDKLLKEQEELHRNLGVCKNLSRQQQDNEDTQKLCALLKQRDMIEDELQKETQCQKQLEKEVD